MDRIVAEILKKHDLVDSGDRLLLALSGGADSVALLHILTALARDYPFTLRAAHLDHTIRVESSHDAEFVRKLCERLNVPLVVESVDVPAVARSRKMGIEEAARFVRRDFLERTALSTKSNVIVLAHHRDDQTETFLHRLIRGAGLSGLASMRLKSGCYIRPILYVSRDKIRGYLKDNALTWVEDPSNRDPSYTRNRIRHQLIPMMQSFNPKISESLASLTHRIALEEDFWEGEVDLALARMIVESEGRIELELNELTDLHSALRFRLFRAVLGRVRGGLQGIEAVHLESMERLLFSDRPQAEICLPGAWVGRRYGRLCVALGPPEPPSPFEIFIDSPGDYVIPSGGFLHVSVEDEARGETSWAVEFDAGAVPFPIIARSFRDGDRFHPQGAPGSKKLKKFFIDKKIDVDLRRRLPIIESGPVLWIPGVRRCEGFDTATGKGKVLRLEFREGEMSTIHL